MSHLSKNFLAFPPTTPLRILLTLIYIITLVFFTLIHIHTYMHIYTYKRGRRGAERAADVNGQDTSTLSSLFILSSCFTFTSFTLPLSFTFSLPLSIYIYIHLPPLNSLTVSSFSPTLNGLLKSRDTLREHKMKLRPFARLPSLVYM